MASNSHNQQTSANRGGASAIATPANSGNIGLFGGSSLGASHNNGEQTQPSNTAAGSGKEKRKSQDGGSMFGNLSNLKRGSQDPSTAQRKSSMSEQGAQPGMIGQMWNKFTQGGGTEK